MQEDLELVPYQCRFPFARRDPAAWGSGPSGLARLAPRRTPKERRAFL